MGEVYRARDTNLGRDVALKMLPEALANDADHISRFQREARTLASLNHPNIAAIYGLVENAIVMELAEGRSLAELIDGKPIPVPQALAIARQIAEALDYAHERGVIHRDLKPANVKITREGRIKVLDFGLAKALSLEPPAEMDPGDSPTLGASVTQAGVVLGTPAYMSPEQARGLPVDKRTDIWGFGAVVFEMLTGQQAFPGQTPSDSLAAVLKSDPVWTALPPDSPAPVRRMIRRCLQRDRQMRMRDIGEAIADIDEALSGATEPSASPIIPAPGSRYPKWLIAVAALSSVAAFLLALVVLRGNAVRDVTTPVPSIRFRVALPGDHSLRPGSHSSSVAVSANGRRVAFVSGPGGDEVLFHRGLGETEPIQVAGLRGDMKSPFLSPDGQWVGIFNSGKLKRVPVGGGPTEIICDVPSGHGGTWNRQGLIVFTSSHSAGLSSVSERGGPVKVLTTPNYQASEIAHYWPVFLPDDKTVLFTVAPAGIGTYDRARVEALQLETGQRRVIVEGGYAARYLDSGHLLYAHGGTLMMAPFDTRELRLTGPAAPVMKGVQIDPLTPPEWDLSPNGVLVFVPGQVFVPESRLVLSDRAGKLEELPDIKEPFVEAPVFSPDGDQIAFAAGTEQTDVWTYSLRRRVVTRVTYDGASSAPEWSPDGQKIAFISRKDGGHSILLTAADGNGKPALLSTRTNLVTHLTFQPDGKAIAFSEYDPQTVDDLWLLPLEGQREPQPLARTPDFEGQPAFAPNGRWLAYTSGSSIARDVYIQAIDGSGRRRASPTGGSLPVWSRDGRELYYMSGRSITAVQISPGPDPVPGPARIVMETSGAGVGMSTSFYDVSPDGRHFVLVRPPAAQAPSKLFEVVVNWNPGR